MIFKQMNFPKYSVMGKILELLTGKLSLVMGTFSSSKGEILDLWKNTGSFRENWFEIITM